MLEVRRVLNAKMIVSAMSYVELLNLDNTHEYCHLKIFAFAFAAALVVLIIPLYCIENEKRHQRTFHIFLRVLQMDQFISFGFATLT